MSESNEIIHNFQSFRFDRVPTSLYLTLLFQIKGNYLINVQYLEATHCLVLKVYQKPLEMIARYCLAHRMSISLICQSEL